MVLIGSLASAQTPAAGTQPPPQPPMTNLQIIPQTNVEYYPKSTRSYLVMSQAHIAKQDKAAAIKDLEKAVELDPSNAQAKTQLENLKK